ncbi:ABC transporter [Microbacterium sp. VKM Ac-2870]|uniref:ABC transporter n=1 Tax=Microbacterium sp. VKM Ac-2870 TaxID=2783825 RepID=UPI00188CF143|nr:ABC transporter [Microbacterium sp. VKM Ac-2870]MBF4561381.1 ABC transporter [Microbacterium sp. VKM Ac-2870]
MSDPKYGDPIEEPTPVETASVDDAVASAHAGLADAEAVSREVAVDEPVSHDAPAADAATTHIDAPTRAESTHGSSYADDPVDEAYVPGAYSSSDAETVAVAEPVVPVVPVVAPAPAPQPIFVQAPEPPRLRGNRGAAGAIGLLAAVVFGVLYLGAALALKAVSGEVTGANVGTAALAAVQSWWLWVPVVVFFIGFWLLGAIINRGRWGHWVIFGLLVGVVAYLGHLLGQLFQAPFWTLTARQGADLVHDQLLAPLAIVAFVLGRELTIWFGAWVAARGKRITEINDEAQREYERTLEAGPRLHQS